MNSRRWATRVAILALVPIVAGVLAPPPAYALGLPTVTTLESNPNPSPACTSVTFKGIVHGGFLPSPPLGLVQFADGGSLLGGPQLITPDFDPDPILGTHIIPTNHSSATISVPLSGGTHFITVNYLGGSDFPSLGTLTQNVRAATSMTVVTSSVNPSVYGQPVALNAAVSSSCPGSVAGSVQFQADGISLGTPQPVDAGGHAATMTSTLAAGTHPLTAVFASTNSDVGGSSGSLPGGQIVHPADTATGVSSSANPSEFGASVAFTAATTVTPPGAGTPSGTVQFQDNGTNLDGPQAVGGAQASVTTASLPVGSQTIAASYASDTTNFNNSAGNLTQVVNKARTTLTYDGAVTADFNDPAALSARLTRTDNGSPVAGKSVTLAMGAESCSAMSDASVPHRRSV